MEQLLLQTLRALPIHQTACSTSASSTGGPVPEEQFVSLLGEKLLPPPGMLDALIAQLPPHFISARTDAHRRVLVGRLGIPQLQAVEFYRQAPPSHGPAGFHLKAPCAA